MLDLFSAFGPVTIRPMFSGFGISVDGVNFAISIKAGLFLRAEPQTEARFVAAGSAPFVYETKARKVTVRSYWRLPERLYDDPDELADWARMALASAQTAALKKPRRPKAAAVRDKADAKAGARPAKAKLARQKPRASRVRK